MIFGQECPNDKLYLRLSKLHSEYCYQYDLKYFIRPNVHNPLYYFNKKSQSFKKRLFDGKTRIHVPHNWYGHYLVYHNVGLKDNTLIVWNQGINKLQKWSKYVKRYQICYDTDNEGIDVPTQLEYFEEPLSIDLINKTCDIIHDDIGFIITPCRIDNNFHLHNDVLLPTFIDLIESNLSFPLLSTNITGYIFDGDNKQKENALILYWMLWIMFNDNIKSYEKEFSNNDITHCFKTLIWGQNRAPLFYNQQGRFGIYQSQQSQIWYYQYYIFIKLGVKFDNFYENVAISISKIQKEKLLQLTPTQIVTKYRPKVMWITRLTGQRRMGNLKDVLRYFQIKGFDIIECCDWSLIHKSLKNDDKKMIILRDYIQKFQDIDILIGLHGAGLTNVLYMKPGSILIELKVPYGFAWASFANIASQMGIAYYTADVRRYCQPLCNFKKKYIKTLIDEIKQRYKMEIIYGKDKTKLFENNKQFCTLQSPKRSDIEILRPFETSRCYHSKMNNKNGKEWFQLFDHSDYWTQFKYRTGTGYGTWPDPDNKII